MQADFRVGACVSDPENLLLSLGAFDASRRKLKKHSRVNLKIGGVIGVILFKRFQLGFNTSIGMNRSISAIQSRKLRSVQSGFFINVNLTHPENL
ncbi:MAG: hypothetical protein ACI8SE_000348 [Bacteroidia bacterium]|jgi:hypothetical protein